MWHDNNYLKADTDELEIHTLYLKLKEVHNQSE